MDRQHTYHSHASAEAAQALSAAAPHTLTPVKSPASGLALFVRAVFAITRDPLDREHLIRAGVRRFDELVALQGTTAADEALLEIGLQLLGDPRSRRFAARSAPVRLARAGVFSSTHRRTP